jgi:hypothetical protein
LQFTIGSGRIVTEGVGGCKQPATLFWSFEASKVYTNHVVIDAGWGSSHKEKELGMAELTEQELDILIRDRAIRLLVLGSGKRIWEASPSPLHQMIIDEIRAAIRPNSLTEGDIRQCGCHHLSDVYIRLPDSSLVRPDIAIFCSPIPRQRQALTVVPPAVIEVISPNYETKDLEDLPPTYLANGILDVVVVDPDQRKVIHFRATETTNHQMPVTIDFQCGCRCTIDV